MSGHVREIISVATLNQRANVRLRQEPGTWLRVKVAEMRVSSSGHWYFTLKDELTELEIPGVMTRREHPNVGFTPCVGDILELHGSIELYVPRSQYQIKIDGMRKINAVKPPPPSSNAPPAPTARSTTHQKSSAAKIALWIGGAVVLLLLLRALF